MDGYEPAPLDKLLIVGPRSGKTLALAEWISSEALFNQPVTLRPAIIDREV